MQNEQLEQRMLDAGIERARTIASRADERGVISETVAGVSAIKAIIKPVTLKVAEWMVEAEARTSGKRGRPPHLFRLCGGMDPEVLAYITAKTCIDKAASGVSLTRMASSVGTGIEDELRLADFEAADRGLYGAIERTMRQRCSSPDHQRKVWSANAVKRSIEITRWTKNERVNVGMVLTDLFIQSSGLIETYLMPLGRNRWQYQTRLTPATKDWLADRTDKAGLLRPVYLPTHERPIQWANTTGGGYGIDRLSPMPLVKRTYRSHVEALQAADLSKVYRSLNAIQDTGWKVNTSVLSVMKEAWDRGLLTSILPNQDDREMPPKPDDIEANQEARREWSKAARDVYEFNAKSKAQRFDFARLLSLADELRDTDALYFPHQLDFRGRVYAVPAGLNPQGPDEARALLTFAEGKPLGERGHFWLGVHGANSFGVDKVSMEERYGWACRHGQRALDVSNDPLGDLWWTEADKPWTFLAWCFEWGAWYSGAFTAATFMSHLPVALDGTCNGLQHFSAMLRDPIGGAAVNLTASPTPQDIYGRVAERTMQRLKAKAEEDNDWVAHGWAAFGIDRKITKRPVMVLPYGGTRISCMDYVRQAVKEKIEGGAENPFGDELQKSTTMLSSHVWDAIGDVVVAARSAMAWLQAAARAATAAGIPCSWVTPSGFPAHQEYREVKRRQIRTRMRGSVIMPLDYAETDALDRSKQALGISPNFVHSMDAAALALTICLCLDHGIGSFAMIHDSYGTHAADTDRLAQCLREAFVSMYEQHDVLAEFRDHLLAQCPTLELPPLPSKGTLDIRAVLTSPYFFA